VYLAARVTAEAESSKHCYATGLSVCECQLHFSKSYGQILVKFGKRFALLLTK